MFEPRYDPATNEHDHGRNSALRMIREHGAKYGRHGPKTSKHKRLLARDLEREAGRYREGNRFFKEQKLDFQDHFRNAKRIGHPDADEHLRSARRADTLAKQFSRMANALSAHAKILRADAARQDREHRAAATIQHRYRRASASPHTTLGRQRILRDGGFDPRDHPNIVFRTFTPS